VATLYQHTGNIRQFDMGKLALIWSNNTSFETRREHRKEHHQILY
jgi:hypothetical protein